jgi:hypothetical protein
MNTQRSSIATPLTILAAGMVLVLIMMFGGSSPNFNSTANAYPIGNEPTSVVATPTAGVPVQPTALPGQPSPTPWPTTIICGTLHRQPELPLAAYPIGEAGKPNAAGQCLPLVSN